MPACSARSKARDSDAHARGVENGTGVRGTGRNSASGQTRMYSRMIGRTRARAAQSSHSGTSTRTCRMMTRLTSALEMVRTSAILGAVSRRDNPGAGRQAMLADASLEQQRVEGLLHVGRAGGHLVEKQAERFGLLGQQDSRRTEDRAFADDARNAAHVLRRDLRSQQRATRQLRLGRRLMNNVRLSHSRRGQQQNALLRGETLNQFASLVQRHRLDHAFAVGRHQLTPVVAVVESVAVEPIGCGRSGPGTRQPSGHMIGHWHVSIGSASGDCTE